MPATQLLGEVVLKIVQKRFKKCSNLLKEV
jgi:hypothetical protein